MPLKPETQQALKTVLRELAPSLEGVVKLVAQRQTELTRAQDQLRVAQVALDELQAKRRAVRQDLGEEP